jgi:hypothetical protein
MSRMLAGRYGVWSEGVDGSPVGPYEVHSWPLDAYLTQYGLGVIAQSWLGGGWSMAGGMIGRAEWRDASVELFGKSAARTHGMMRGSGASDRWYEFFLVVRPRMTGLGRLVRTWQVPAEALGVTWVEGFLAVDGENDLATVTITGLVKPIEDRIDLAETLR